MPTPAPSQKDGFQVLKYAFDDPTGTLRTTATIAPGGADLEIHYEDDSIAIGDPSSNNILKINSDGSINVSSSGALPSDVSIIQGGNTATVTSGGALVVTGDQTVTGTVTTEQAGLNNFQTSQYSVDNSVVQITPTPLSGRSSISFRVTTTGTNAIFIGNNSGLNINNGYPLYNGDTLQMDLTPVNNIYAVATAIGQTLFVLEIA